jgi:zinc/manganese transport system substrate-binding protein
MYKKLILILSLLYMAQAVQANIRIFACEPEWAALASELGGNKVDIYQATSAFQDPHHIEARPSLIAKMRRADMLVCTGAGLEEGWLPLVIRQSANQKVLPGQPGHFEAAMQIPRLDIPETVDRQHGDVHPQGNPHVHLDPRRLIIIARALTTRLGKVDAAELDYYQQRLTMFEAKWNKAIQRWEQQAEPLKGINVAVYHKDWLYLFDWLKINIAATLEPRPGIAPSAGYLASLKSELKTNPARMVVYASYQSDRAANWLGQQLKYPVVKLPYTVGGSEDTKSLVDLFDVTINRMLSALQNHDD